MPLSHTEIQRIETAAALHKSGAEVRWVRRLGAGWNHLRYEVKGRAPVYLAQVYADRRSFFKLCDEAKRIWESLTCQPRNS